MGLSDSIKEQNKTENEILRAENDKLKRTMRLHAGDCCSLNNEVGLFRSHWDDAEKRVDELQEKLVLAMSQNYCKICGNTLDGYVPPDNKCKWAYDYNYDMWETRCANAFTLMNGTPKENKMIFCPYCGKKIDETQKRF